MPFQCAERVLYRLRAMDNKSPQAPWSWRVEEARMFWSRGEHDTAKYLMKKLSSEMAEVGNYLMYMDCLYYISLCHSSFVSHL